MVLYGQASIVWRTPPEVCYPATGFRAMLPSRDQDLEIRIPEKSTPARFGCNISSSPWQGRPIIGRFTTRSGTPVDGGSTWGRTGSPFATTRGCSGSRCSAKVPAGGKADENSVQELLGRIVREMSSGRSASWWLNNRELRRAVVGWP